MATLGGIFGQRSGVSQKKTSMPLKTSFLLVFEKRLTQSLAKNNFISQAVTIATESGRTNGN